MASNFLRSDELDFIAKKSGIEPSVIRSWHKEFLQACPTGKMVNFQIKKYIFNFY